MKKLKIYLDMCSHNRPFDSQVQMKIRLETEAKLYIQTGVREGRHALCWSFVLDYENGKNPYREKRNVIALWKDISDDYCSPSETILLRGMELKRLGIKNEDALHIACAIEKECDYFVTTDKDLLNKAIVGIRIINPIDFVRETEG